MDAEKFFLTKLTFFVPTLFFFRSHQCPMFSQQFLMIVLFPFSKCLLTFESNMTLFRDVETCSAARIVDGLVDLTPALSLDVELFFGLCCEIIARGERCTQDNNITYNIIFGHQARRRCGFCLSAWFSAILN